MSAGEGQRRERFAAAVEQGLDAASIGDEELRRELELVALLQRSGEALAPSADASARMRARVMAEAAGIMSAPATPSSVDSNDTSVIPQVDESVNPETLTDVPLPATELIAKANDEDGESARPNNVVSLFRRGRHRTPTQAPSPAKRSLISASAAAGLMVIAVTGGGAMFSQGALPGDSLYGVKQATESAIVGVTPGQGNKAQRQLDMAATRIDEVRELNGQQAAPASTKGQDISQALKGFDEQTAAGSRMALSSGANNKAQMGSLANWAESQSQKLSSMRASLPAESQADADHSLRQLEDVRTRAQSVSNRQGCDRVLSSESDQLGPLPAKGACSVKDAPAPTKSLVPSESVKSVKPSSPSSSDSDSDESSSANKSDKSDKRSGESGLFGNNRDGLNGLHNREQVRGNDLLPEKSPAEQPKPPNLLEPLLPGLQPPSN